MTDTIEKVLAVVGFEAKFAPPVKRRVPRALGFFPQHTIETACFSRMTAKQTGAKRFFSFRACPHGHIGWRYVRNGGCCECAAPSDAQPGTSRHFRSLLASSKQRAKLRGLPWSLCEEDIAEVYPEDGRCPVLGIPLRRKVGLGRQGGAPDSPTLDRIVPEKGYVRGNILVVSDLANRVRGDASVDEIDRVALFYRRLGVR